MQLPKLLIGYRASKFTPRASPFALAASIQHTPMSEGLEVRPLNEDTKARASEVRTWLKSHGQWGARGEKMDAVKNKDDANKGDEKLDKLKDSVKLLVEETWGISPGRDVVFIRAHAGGTGLISEGPIIALCADDNMVYIATRIGDKEIVKCLDPSSFLYVGPNQKIRISENVPIVVFRK